MRLPGWLVLVAAMALPAEAFAQISLSLTPEVDSSKLPELSVVVSVSNGGKESAHRLRPSIQVGAARVALPELQELKPGQAHKFSASVAAPATKPGTYPVFVTVGYADANGYSFSALASSSYSSGEATASDVFGVLTASPISGQGELSLRLKNNSGGQQAITLTPFLPAELTPEGLPGTVTLAAGAEQELTGRVRNFSALGGSRYPIFVAAEYETADRHFSNVITTMVDVVPAGTTFGAFRNWIIGAAALLFLAALWKMTRSRKPRRS